MLAKFITQMLQGEQPTIFGDGKQSRDFTFVENVVDANLLACKAENRRSRRQGVQRRHRPRIDLYQTFLILKKLIGYSGDVKYGPERAGDVKHSLADISQAAEISWLPAHSGFRRRPQPNHRVVPQPRTGTAVEQIVTGCESRGSHERC